MATGNIRGLAVAWVGNQFATYLNVYCALPEWDVSRVRSLRYVFYKATRFDADLNAWKTSSVTDLSYAFYATASFRGKGVARWDVAGVTAFTQAFRHAKLFDADLSAWKTSSVTDLSYAFSNAASFKGVGVNKFDVAKVRTLQGTFSGARLFDADLNAWDTSSATSLYAMFLNAASFRGVGVASMNVAKVYTFSQMFAGVKLFDADLSAWDTSSAIYMTRFFRGATAFTGAGVSSWDVARVKSLQSTFEAAVVFNGDVAAWQVSQVTDITATFARASAFNINIAKWDVSRVETFFNALGQTVAMNQDLNAWMPAFAARGYAAGNIASFMGYRRPSAAWAKSAAPLLHGGLPARAGGQGAFRVDAGTDYTVPGPFAYPRGLDLATAFTSFGNLKFGATRFRVQVEPPTRDLVFYDAETGTWVLQPKPGKHNGTTYTATLIGTDTDGNGGVRWKMDTRLGPAMGMGA